MSFLVFLFPSVLRCAAFWCCVGSSGRLSRCRSLCQHTLLCGEFALVLFSALVDPSAGLSWRECLLSSAQLAGWLCVYVLPCGGHLLLPRLVLLMVLWRGSSGGVSRSWFSDGPSGVSSRLPYWVVTFGLCRPVACRPLGSVVYLRVTSPGRFCTLPCWVSSCLPSGSLNNCLVSPGCVSAARGLSLSPGVSSWTCLAFLEGFFPSHLLTSPVSVSRVCFSDVRCLAVRPVYCPG